MDKEKGIGEVLDTARVAKLIHRTPGAVRALVMRRRIPFRKPGGRLVFIKREIEAWIDMSPGVRLDDLDK